MSAQFDGDAETSAPAPLPAFDDVPRDHRAVRALVAGAAGIAVLAGGAVGFVWLSGAPQADASALGIPGAIVTPSVTEGSTGRGDAAYSFGSRNIFAPTVAPAAAGSEADGVEVSTSTSSAGSSGGTGTGSGGSGSASGNGGSGTGGSGTGGTPTGTPTSGTSPSDVPSPGTTSPAPVSTPSPSTAPGWVKPSVAFVGGTATSATFDIAGETRVFATGDLVYPLNVRYAGLVDGTTDQGLFTYGDDAAIGWIVTANAESPTVLPDAALGEISGRVRVYAAVAGEKDTFWATVNDTTHVKVSLGAPVGDTGLTLSAVDGLGTATGQVSFKDQAGSTFLGRSGGGEYDGVWF